MEGGGGGPGLNSGPAAASAATWGSHHPGGNGCHGGPPLDFHGQPHMNQVLAAQQQQQQHQPALMMSAGGTPVSGPSGGGAPMMLGQQLGLAPLNQQQVPSYEGSTLNMMIQGMAANLLQSPPHSSAPAAPPNYLFLPGMQPGMGPPHPAAAGGAPSQIRDSSPSSSTSNLPSQPPIPSAATPPPPNNMMGGGAGPVEINERQQMALAAAAAAAAAAANPNMMFGPRMLNPSTLTEKSLMDEQFKQQSGGSGGGGGNLSEFLSTDNFQQQQQQPGNGLRHPHQGGNEAQQLTLNQIQEFNLARAAGINPVHYIPAPSPPGAAMHFQQQMPQPMPPRPRPEGGQDPSPTFSTEQDGLANGNHQQQLHQQQIQHQMCKGKESSDLIIGSWTNDDAEKVQQGQGGNLVPPLSAANFNSGAVPATGSGPPLNALLMQQQRMEAEQQAAIAAAASVTIGQCHKDAAPTGWGDLPVSNLAAPNGWGSAQPPPSVAPKVGDWGNNPCNPYGNPPPNTPPQSYHEIVSAPRGGGYRGRGGGSGYRGGGEPDFGSGLDQHVPPHQGNRGGGYRGRGSYTRGGRGRGGNNVDLNMEKMDGKKNAIAETIAMMKKMKMDDQEKKEARKKWMNERRERNKEQGMDTPEPPISAQDSEPLMDEPLHRRNQREREQRSSGRGGRNGPSMGGGPRHGGTGMGLMRIDGIGQPQPPGGPQAGIFMQPPSHPAAAAAIAAAAAAAGIPAFPGLESFMPPACGGPGPQAFGGSGFPGSYPGGPGPGFYLGAGPGGGPGNFNMSSHNPGLLPFGGRGFQPRVGRGAISGFPPRGFPGGGPMGVGSPRGMSQAQRSRGRGGLAPRTGSVLNKTTEDENDITDGNNREVGNGGTGESGEEVVKERSESGGQTQDGKANENGTDSKNVNSEQGIAGQLALLASETLAGGKRKNHRNHVSSNRDKTPGVLEEADHVVTCDNLRERLISQLVDGEAECMVCLDKIKPKNAIWDCQQCYQIFHIHCIKKWARNHTSDVEGAWPCPGCRGLSAVTPNCYRCFCRKIEDPPYDLRETPHSCGEVCGKNRNSCPHKCLVLCHPGPCPPCNASVCSTCPCGKTSQAAKCGSVVFCDNLCGKILNCNVHFCEQKCHQGSCTTCQVSIVQTCFCPAAKTRTVPCSTIENGGRNFSCGEICSRLRDCGNHNCDSICHSGACQPCPSSPDLVKTCPCGRTIISARNSCLDAVSTCGNVCGKRFFGCVHTCSELCHLGPCRPCPLETRIKCNCGSTEKFIACSDSANSFVCDRPCSKRMKCGRHKCTQVCCVDPLHNCTIICGRLLSCGTHRCQDVCHIGNCVACSNVSFDELPCRCGRQVLYPPLACGTSPPPCNEPCSISRSCGHAVRHSCHPETQSCPPCVELINRQCHGKHEKRKSVPCHLEAFSCGKPCGQALPCGRHYCLLSCHPGDCAAGKCDQPCQCSRPECGHPCGAACHEGSCPSDTPCNEKVILKCECGHLSKKGFCSAENEPNYQRIKSSQLMWQLEHQLAGGGSCSVDIRGSFATISANVKNSKASEESGGRMTRRILPCNEECALIERNRRVAEALNIETPKFGDKDKLLPKYSDLLKTLAKKDLAFARRCHEQLTQLVKLSKESKQKMKTHSFECMKREKRQFLHELAPHFGCSTQSFDLEPKRNVVATAVKDKVYLPNISIVEVVQGLRKVPLSTTNKRL